jgi:hypothetical protein
MSKGRTCATDFENRVLRRIFEPKRERGIDRRLDKIA